MEIAITITLFFHLLGMAALVGGTAAQIKAKERKITPLILHGALTQLVTGFMLVGFVQANDEKLDMAVVATKLIILAIILGLVFIGRKKLSENVFYSILFLAITNVGLALFVTSSS